nr:hypothetical protein [Tanacetum cinerariifolium]
MTVAVAKETVDSQVVQQTRIQCFNCKESGHFTKEYMKPKRAKDYTYHKKKMLLCKQAERGVPLQHSKQPESINNTCVVKKVDSNVIPNSPNTYANDIQTDQNVEECDDEHAGLANLIANLTLDTEENKKILKQLKKANASLTQ